MPASESLRLRQRLREQRLQWVLVAVVVAMLFAAAFVTIPTAPVVAVLFVVCMGALVGSLLCFLIEVRIATGALRFGTNSLQTRLGKENT